MIARHHCSSADRARRLALFACRSLTLTFLVLGPPVTAPAHSEVVPKVTSHFTIPWSGVLSSDVEDIFLTGSLDIQVESVSVHGTLFTKLRSSISDTTGFGMTSRQEFIGVGGGMSTCSLPASSRAIGRFPVEVSSQQRLLVKGAVVSQYEASRQAPLPLVFELTLSGDGRPLGAQVRMGKTRFRDQRHE